MIIKLTLEQTVMLYSIVTRYRKMTGADEEKCNELLTELDEAIRQGRKDNRVWRQDVVTNTKK